MKTILGGCLAVILFVSGAIAQTNTVAVIVANGKPSTVENPWAGTDSIKMTDVEAQKIYDGLLAKSRVTQLSQDDIRWMAALTIALGVVSSPGLDCSQLSHSDQMRVQMGSREAASKCTPR